MTLSIHIEEELQSIQMLDEKLKGIRHMMKRDPETSE